MKTSEQIKGQIRNIAKKTGVNPNSLLQMCLFEGVLEKLAKSKYKDKFIIKGGLLISSLLGVDMRSTMDMDATVKGIAMNEDEITKIITEILEIPIGVDIKYHLAKLTPIREKNIYEDFCASIICSFGKIKATLNIDITSGDVITPKSINYNYPKILEKGHIPVMAYTIETILAEKFETISSRNIATTRARDFYDLYMLYSVYKDTISKEILKEAIEKTSKNRGTYQIVIEHEKIFKMLKESKQIEKLWDKYVKANVYAKKVKLEDAIFVYEQMGQLL